MATERQCPVGPRTAVSGVDHHDHRLSPPRLQRGQCSWVSHSDANLPTDLSHLTEEAGQRPLLGPPAAKSVFIVVILRSRIAQAGANLIEGLPRLLRRALPA